MFESWYPSSFHATCDQLAFTMSFIWRRAWHFPFTFLSQDRRLYWCDAGLNRIESVDFDGNNRIKLFEYHQINIHPFDLSISGTDLYWSDWAFYTLVRMDKYAGSNAELVGPPVLQQAGGLHIGRISTLFSVSPRENMLEITISQTTYDHNKMLEK